MNDYKTLRPNPITTVFVHNTNPTESASKMFLVPNNSCDLQQQPHVNIRQRVMDFHLDSSQFEIKII